MNKIWCLRPTEKFGIEIIKKFFLYKKSAVDLITCNQNFAKNFDNKKFKELKKKILINNEILAQEKKLFQKKFDINTFLKIYSLKEFYKYRLLAIENLTRNERYFGELNFDERNSFVFNQFLYWSEKINIKKPKLILFFDIPHMYYEIIILGIAKIKKIPVMIIQNNERNTFFYDNDFNPISNLKNSKYFSDVFKKNIIRQKKSNQKKNTFNYIDNFKHLLRKGTLGLLFSIFKFIYKPSDINSNFIKSTSFTLKINNIINERVQLIKYIVKCLINQYTYEKISIKKLPKKFVYFPLVSNFEADLMPGCSPWTQYEIIKSIANKLDNQTFLCIKEHPRQFKIRYHQQFSRPKNFYKEISKNQKVKFLSIQFKNIDIIKNSNFVVCSSLSTSSLETIFLNKKIFYFGPKILPTKYAKPIDQFSIKDSKKKNFFIDEKIYYPYKQNLRNFSKKHDDYQRFINHKDINSIFNNILEYYKKIK